MGARLHAVSAGITVLVLSLSGAIASAQDVCMASSTSSRGRTASLVRGPGAPQSRYDDRLGAMFSAEVDAKGRAVARIDTTGLTVVKTTTAFGDTTLALRFGSDRVEFRLSPDSISVLRGRAQAALNPKSLTEADLAAAERVIRGSRAVRAFKQLAAQIEGGHEPDDVFTLGVLVDGALVRILDGEVGVVHRLGHRLKARQRGRILQASLALGTSRFEDCVTEWEVALLENWDTFWACVGDAGDAAWYLRSVLAATCELEFVLRGESAMFQFVGCSAIPIG